MAALASSPQVNGSIAHSTVEEEDFYTQLLRLRDAVVAGEHPQLKLSASAIQRLQANLLEAEPSNGDSQNEVSLANPQIPKPSSALSLPGLGQSSTQSAVPLGATAALSSGLDPIFLEKSNSLIRAEGALKRQRIERELDQQVHERRHTTRDRDQAVEAPSLLDVDTILREAQKLIFPVSGIPPSKDDDASSFDTNSYYSSKAGDTWSESTASYDPEDAPGAFTADFEQFDTLTCDAPSNATSRRVGKVPVPSKSGHLPPYADNQRQSKYDDLHESEDEDEEYSPPDADTFDDSRLDAGEQTTPPNADDDDYEPGEIGEDSTFATPTQQPAQPSPRVPIIRNHLTHIAAPQPNRVSPLAVAKGPSMELGLVNGKPELVQKPQYGQQSRPSSGSPINGHGSSTRRRRNKKRKRDIEPGGKGPKKRNRLSGAHSPLHSNAQAYIKPEPISPPPFAAAADPSLYSHDRRASRMPAEINLISPRQVAPLHHADDRQPKSGLRYEYLQPPTPTVLRPASPATYQRSVQRDTHDLRRVATLQHAHRPASPSQVNDPRVYTPIGPYHSLSTAQLPYEQRHPSEPSPPHLQYVPAPTPPQFDDYRPEYDSRGGSPALMPPPPPRERQIVVDQYGNRYYAEPAPPAQESRSQIAPPSFRQADYVGYGEAPKRPAHVYTEPPSADYDPADSRMAPPPLSNRYADGQVLEYVDAEGRRVRAYSTRPEPARGGPQPPPAAFQTLQRYDMPAPVAYTPDPLREPTSPTYTAPSAIRAYSTRPEIPPQPSYHSSLYQQQGVHRFDQPGGAMPAPYVPRQASVAPVQYGRQGTAAPPQALRAASLAPGGDYGAQQTRSYAPQPVVRYVDAQGQEVYPQDVRQMSGGEYRY